MKKFLLVSFALLVIALLMAVGVFYYLSFKLVPAAPEQDVERVADIKTTASSVEYSTNTVSAGIPLRELPLEETQKKVLESLGIDVATFVISPAMQDCVSLKLGAKRLAEVVAGAVPSAWETAQLLPCLQTE
jgi:hypothetical protein